MLIVKSRYSFTSAGPDRVSILKDAEIPALAAERGWPFVALADERTMAGTLEFLAAARAANIKAAAGIQISNIRTDDGIVSLILLALQQSGLQRLMAGSAELQKAETLRDVCRALAAQTPPERPDIMAGIAVPATGTSQADPRKTNDALRAAMLGPIGVRIGAHGQASYEWAGASATAALAREAGLAMLDVQTGYAKNDLHPESVSTLNAFSAIRATAQAKHEVGPPETPASHAIPAYDPATHDDPATLALVSRIAPMRLDHPPMLPESLGLADGQDANETLCRLARDGLYRMLEDGTLNDRDLAEERLEYELSVIQKKGFANYFLIIRDAIDHARSKSIPVGPGRGSVAGSLVAYTTGITRIDPLRHKLFFERFINPERTSLPDIDTDFCADRRVEVFEYLRERYGANRVAHIATYADAKPRSTIRDAARILGTQGAATGLIATLEAALPKSSEKPKPEEIVKLLADISADPATPAEQARIARLASFALNMPSTTSIHAGGIVLSDRATTDHAPLLADPDQDGLPVAQFSMEIVEKTGLTKFDFLSLKTLTVIAAAIRLIRRRTGIQIDIDRIPQHDPAVCALISTGKTQTIFQLDSNNGIGAAAKEIGISSMADIIALVALYRPGPMKYIPTYAACKHGEREVTYPHPSLEEILRDTYGIIVYQEQIIQIAQTFAGYTPGEADILRKAVGKKKADILARERGTFVRKAVENGNDLQDAENIFDFILPFAEYGFNKSHAAAYALIAWQTAWLRHHYPAEWFAACAQNHTRKSAASDILKMARNLGTPIMLPDINGPVNDFETGTDDSGRPIIICPLAFVEKTKRPALDAIAAARRNTRFGSATHMLSLVGTQHNATIIALASAGALDSLTSHPPAIGRAMFHALTTSSATSRPDTKADTRQQGLFIVETANETTKDPQPTSLKANPLYDYQPIAAADMEEEFHTLLNGLATTTTKGSSTATSDWLRRVENLLTLDAARRIAAQTPARALAVLTSIHDQAEAIAAGRRIIEASVEDETGQYRFDLAPGVEIDPILAARGRKTMVRLTLAAAPKGALLSGRVVITAIETCPDPLTSEEKTYPLIHTDRHDTTELMAAIAAKSLEAARRFSADRKSRKNAVIPTKPDHALIVTPDRRITPVLILEPVRYYGITPTFGDVAGITQIET